MQTTYTSDAPTSFASLSMSMTLLFTFNQLPKFVNRFLTFSSVFLRPTWVRSSVWLLLWGCSPRPTSFCLFLQPGSVFRSVLLCAFIPRSTAFGRMLQPAGCSLRSTAFHKFLQPS